MEKLILAIDQGTTSTTALLVNDRLEVIARSSTEVLPSYPQYSWVEHDLDQIWEATLNTIKKLLDESKIQPAQIAGIGITNQRETVGAWSRRTMIPFHKAIVWQCRRTSDRCLELKKMSGLEQKIRKITGLVLDPYFSATKMEWLLKNVPNLKAKAEAGELAFGTIDSFLVYRMSFGAAHVTDVSNASRTMLMDLETLSWDKSLLDLFGISENTLPRIHSSSEIYGRTKNMRLLPDGIPICGILGDQQAALFGQLCTSPGEAKCTYGTGSFLMCNTGSEIVHSKHGLLTTVGWKIGDQTNYALEGSAFVAGAAVQFLRDNLGIIRSSSEIEGLALSAEDKDMGELVFVPALTGLGAPHWKSEARGMFYGLTRGTTRAHLARATLEGIALQNDDLLGAVQEDISPKRLLALRVDGGASANNYLMQLQSDLAGVKIVRPKVLETTALGAAMMAGLAVKLWPNLESLRAAWKLDREFEPAGNLEKVHSLKTKWRTAIRRVCLE